MSELNTYYIPTRSGNSCLCYLKSEVDKVIAEKDKQIEEVKHQRDGAFGLTNLGLTLDDLSQMARKQIAHQKYKRCLAMAQEWRNYAAFCGMQSHCHNHRGFGKTAEKYTWKEIHAWKCVNRYKELAEKFKEV